MIYLYSYPDKKLTPLKDLRSQLGHVNSLLHEIRARLENLDNAMQLGIAWDIGFGSNYTRYMDSVIITVEDILFVVVTSQHKRKGSVYVGLQLSEAAGGRLRLIGYLSDKILHSSESLLSTAPGPDEVDSVLIETLGERDRLLYVIDRLRACNPKITKTSEQLLDEIIVS